MSALSGVLFHRRVFFLGKLATRAKVEFEGGWGEFECDIVAK